MRIHIVQKGDTLWTISQKYGVNFEELKSVNTQLSDPSAILPGMKIKVPQGTKQVKKEAPKKEEAAKKPYKDTSPKPIPAIKEDEKMPAKKPAMEKPMMPMQPIHMNMPSVEQKMQNYYTTFHLPQMPMPEQAEGEHKKEEHKKEEPEESVAPQPFPPHYAPAHPYCPPLHPQLVHSEFYCCPPQPGMMPAQMPMPHQPMMPMYGGMDDGEPSSGMQGNVAGSDCGCSVEQGQHQTYPPMMGYAGFPPQGYQGQPFIGPPAFHQPPMGGWHPQYGNMGGGNGSQFPIGAGQPSQFMEGWDPNQAPMGYGNPDTWRDDDLDED